MIRLADIRGTVAREGRVVLVLVLEAQGSAPRDAGAAMLVAPGGALGTVGGGTVEHRAQEIARAMLAGEVGPRAEVEFPLGPTLDQCCGGRMRLALALLAAGSLGAAPQGGPRRLILSGSGEADRSRGSVAVDLSGPETGGEERGGAAETRPGAPETRCAGRMGEAAECAGPLITDVAVELWPGGPVFLEPAAPRQVVVYGAGHVGTALVRALAPLPFRLDWVDARAGACAAAPEGVAAHETPLPEEIVGAAEADACHIVLTHSHALDLEIVTAVLRRSFGWCGLIGSATKRATFRRRLAERGVPREAIERLVCPIGLPGLRDKRPAVIAASVAAQLCQLDAARAVPPPTARAG